MHLRRRFPAYVCLALLAAAPACSDDDPAVVFDAEDDRGGRVVPDGGLIDVAEDADDATDAQADTPDDAPDASADAAPDAEPDVEADAQPDAQPDVSTDIGEDPCDQDGDGYRAISCGGNDCDDESIRDNPGARERCDFTDNNCSGGNNEGIVCEFYALTGDNFDTGAQAGLYLVDPFAATYTRVDDVPDGSFDFDTTSDGTLYSMTEDDLFRYDEANDRWDNIANLSGVATNANGLAIDSGNVAYVTAENFVYEVDLVTGAIREVGSMGTDAGVQFYSSGDCVVDKNDVLYVSSRYGDITDERDCLVRVDTVTGQGTFLGILSHDRVYALTAAWGFMFGLTSSGELINIDPTTGTSTLVANLDNLRFFGAASTPGR